MSGFTRCLVLEGSSFQEFRLVNLVYRVEVLLPTSCKEVSHPVFTVGWW